MSWMQRLYDVYNACESEVGSGRVPLCPLCHTVKQFHIESHIDENGKWLNGSRELTDKDEMLTIIPCTSASVVRTSRGYPYPLFDELGYVAGDFSDKFKSDYDLYIEQLEKWCGFSKRIKPIFTYLQKGTLIADLTREGIIPVKMLSDEKTAIRFVVHYADENPSLIWEDREIRDSWIRYQQTFAKPLLDYCFVLGDQSEPAGYIPKNIRYQGDGTKLISTKDGNFKWRGRFTTAEQAYSVSGEVMEKAHSALRWLIGRQGERNGDQVILAFGSGGVKSPPITQGLSYDDDGEEAPKIIDTFAEFANRFNRAISGYGIKLDGAEDAIIIGLDAATPGRLSIFYYSEMPWKELIDNIREWHWQTSWLHTYGKRSYFGAPSPMDIIEVTYGENADDKIKKSVTKRLLPCIANGARLPLDIMRLTVNRAGNPANKDAWRIRKEISVACALIRKYYHDHKKEELTVALDTDNTDRSYLFGRAFAYLDCIERKALNKRDEDRRTNAQRLMPSFRQHPKKTVGDLRIKIEPYLKQLSYGSAKFYERGLNDILDTIGIANMTNTPLDELYLVGYASQLKELETFKTNMEDDSDE